MTVKQIATCVSCAGRGELIDQPCPECGGRGEAAREETLTVKIPAGIDEGTALRIPGRGLPSRERGGVPGDLFVIVRTAPDPRFERDGAHLWRTASLSIPDVVLGTSLEVPTLDGPATVEIPPGTQPDAVLRLRAKGLPELGGRRRGDLYLRVRVHVPERLGPEERKLYEHLRTLGTRSGRAKP